VTGQEPVSITVERVFELLDAALNEAIEKGGNGAKSVAWDVRGYFLREIGHYRVAAKNTGEGGLR
jgi:hypothetical protein